MPLHLVLIQNIPLTVKGLEPLSLREREYVYVGVGVCGCGFEGVGVGVCVKNSELSVIQHFTILNHFLLFSTT